MMSNFANFVQALAVLLTCISLSAGQGGTFVGKDDSCHGILGLSSED